MTGTGQPLADLERREAALPLVSSGGCVPGRPVPRTWRAVQESQELFWVVTAVLDAARCSAWARLAEWDAARRRIRAGHPSRLRERVVPAEQLAEQLWEGSLPPGAAGTLRSHVSRVRALTGPDAALFARGGGYALAAGPDQQSGEGEVGEM